MLELLKTYLHDAFIVILAFCGLVFVLRFLLPGLLLWLRLGGGSTGDWGVRVAGLALAASAGWALWMAYAHDAAPWCVTP